MIVICCAHNEIVNKRDLSAKSELKYQNDQKVGTKRPHVQKVVV